MFIHYLSATAFDIAKLSNNKTLLPQHIFKALETLELDELLPSITKDYEGTPQQKSKFQVIFIAAKEYSRLKKEAKKLNKTVDKGTGKGKKPVTDEEISEEEEEPEPELDDDDDSDEEGPIALKRKQDEDTVMEEVGEKKIKIV